MHPHPTNTPEAGLRTPNRNIRGLTWNWFGLVKQNRFDVFFNHRTDQVEGFSPTFELVSAEMCLKRFQCSESWLHTGISVSQALIFHICFCPSSTCFAHSQYSFRFCFTLYSFLLSIKYEKVCVPTIQDEGCFPLRRFFFFFFPSACPFEEVKDWASTFEKNTTEIVKREKTSPQPTE